MSQRLTIACFLNNFNGGGGERAHIMLANGLSELGNRVFLVVVNRSGPYEELISSSVTVIDLKKRRAFLAVPALVHALRKLKPDLVLSALVIANVVTAIASIALPKLPIFAIEHGDMHEAYLSDNGRLATKIGYWLAPFVYRRFTRVFCVDESSMNSVLSFTDIRDLPATVMPNAVITEEMEMRAISGCNHPYFALNVPVFINVGRLADQKNQSLLLRSFAKFIKQHDARLIILGEGPLRGALEIELAELGLEGYVELPGFLDPFPFMVQADALILTSRWEALPTVIIEAMFCGCNVVVTNASKGTLELVENGELGYVAINQSEEDILKQMKACLDNPIPKVKLRNKGSKYKIKAVAELYQSELAKSIKSVF